MSYQQVINRQGKEAIMSRTYKAVDNFKVYIIHLIRHCIMQVANIIQDSQLYQQPANIMRSRAEHASLPLGACGCQAEAGGEASSDPYPVSMYMPPNNSFSFPLSMVGGGRRMSTYPV